MALVFPVVHPQEGTAPVPTWEMITSTSIAGKSGVIAEEHPLPDFYTRDTVNLNFITRPIVHNDQLHIGYTVPYDTGERDLFARVVRRNNNGTWDTLGSISDVINPATQASFLGDIFSFEGSLYASFAVASKAASAPFGNSWPRAVSNTYIYKYNETTNVWEQVLDITTTASGRASSINSLDTFFVKDGSLHFFFISRSYSLGTTRNYPSWVILNENGTWTRKNARKEDGSDFRISRSPNTILEPIINSRFRIIGNKFYMSFDFLDLYYEIDLDSRLTTGLITPFSNDDWAAYDYNQGLNPFYARLVLKNGDLNMLSNAGVRTNNIITDYSNAKDNYWLAEKNQTPSSFSKPMPDTFFFARDYAEQDGKDYLLLSVSEGAANGATGGIYVFRRSGSTWAEFGGGPVVSGTNIRDIVGNEITRRGDQFLIFLKGDPHVVGFIKEGDNKASFIIARALL